MTIAAKQAIRNEVRRILDIARDRFPSYTAPDPSVLFDIRGRTRGGTATGSHTLQFNLDWYAASPEYYMSHIVPHEVAHIVASATRMGRGHDSGWRYICLALGGSGDRLNTCPIINTEVRKARRVRQYLYKAERGEVWVGPRHHSRLQREAGVRLRSKSAGLILYSGFTGQSRIT